MPWELLSNANIESVTATDESTLVFKLERPNLTILPAILNRFAGWIYPPEVIKEHGDAGDWKNLVGTGPYMLTDSVEGSSVTWKKNPDYWGTDEKYPENRLPYIDQLKVLIMIEPATRLAEASYPNGFKTTMIHLDRYDLNYIQLLASYWKKIGVEVEIDVHSPASYSVKKSGERFNHDECGSGWKSIATLGVYDPVWDGNWA